MKKFGIITIERQFASGGREIGKKLAEKLEIPCYGEEILKRAAELCHSTPEYLEHLEETVTNSFLYSLVMLGKSVSWKSDEPPIAENLNIIEGKVIRELADKGDCVIIGRCASYFLSDRKDCLNIFVHADRDSRRERAVSQYGISEKNVDNILKSFDKKRANYYHANSGKEWLEPSNYHMMLDSGRLGCDRCADIIEFYVRGI